MGAKGRIYEPRGEDNLCYCYTEEKVNKILRRRAGEQKPKKEVIDLTREDD